MFGMSRIWLAVTRAIESGLVIEEAPSYTYETYVKSLLPLAYWRLGDSVAGTAVDEIGNYDGTHVNTPTVGTTSLLVSDADTSTTFDGVNQHITWPADTLSKTQAITASVIIKPNMTSGIGVALDFAGNIGYRRIDVEATTKTIELYNYDGTAHYYITAPYTENNTYHVVCVYDMPNSLGYIYINGVLIDSGAIGATTSNHSVQANMIGGHTQDGGAYYKGDLDEVCVFDYILSQAEITNLYELSLAGRVEKPLYVDYAESLLPVAYWRLGESVGTVAYDISGNNKHGTYANSPTLSTTGLLVDDTDTTVTLNGTTQFITTGHTFSLETEVSVSLLFNTSSVATNQIFVGDLASSGLNKNSRILFGIEGANWYLNIGDDTGFYLFNTIPHNLSNNITYNIVLTYNATNYTIYKDGILVHSGTSTIALGTANTIPLHIGIFGDTLARYLVGKIDEVLVFNKALTQIEIETLYLKSVGITTEPLTYYDTARNLMPVAYYRLGEPTGATAFDETGAYNGSYVGTPTLGATGLLVGDSDTAVSNDGTAGNYISTGISLATDADFTIICSIRMTSVAANTSFFSQGATNQFLMWMDAGGGTRLLVNGANRIVSSSILADQTYYIALIKSGTTTSLYFNNNLEGTTETSLATTGNMLFGNRSGVNDGHINGTFDEIALFNTALTQSQVTKLYNASKASQFTLTIDSTKVTEDLYDFPVLVNLDVTSGITSVDSTGVFTSLREGSNLSFWKLDGDVTDANATYNGTQFGTPAYTNAVYPHVGLNNKGNSSDDYIMFAGLGTWFAGRTAFTFSVSSSPQQVINGTSFLFCVSNTTHVAPQYRFGVQFKPAEIILYFNSVTLRHNGTYDVNTIYDITATWDGITVNLYLDGVFATSLAYSTAIGTCHPDASIGRIPALNSTSNYGLYEVNNVSIFDRALTSAEVQQLTISWPTKLKVIYPLSNFNKPIEVNDEFTGTNGDAPDTLLWAVIQSTPTIQSNKLQASITGATSEILSNYYVSGDFDAQVDIDLTTFSGDRSLVAFYAWIDSANYWIVYIDKQSTLTAKAGSSTTGGGWNLEATSATLVLTSSKLRIVRVGTSISLKYWGGTAWVDFVTSAFTSSADVLMRLTAGSSVTNPLLVVDYDNFKLNSGIIVWPIYDALTKVTQECKVEIDRWDSVNKQAQLWVKVPYISKDADTVITLDANPGNPVNANVGYTGSVPAIDVWTEYDAVYHLSLDGSDSAASSLDGTLNGIDGTNIVDFGVGKGMSFNGTDEWIDLGLTTAFDLTATDSMTVESTFSMNDNAISKRVLQNSGSGNAGTKNGFQIATATTTAADFSNSYVENTSTGYSGLEALSSFSFATLTSNTFQFDQSNGQMYVYKDGVNVIDGTSTTIVGDMTDTTVVASRNTTIGCAWDNSTTRSQYMAGSLKEIRFSKSLKTGGWIAANYESTSDTLITFS